MLLHEELAREIAAPAGVGGFESDSPRTRQDSLQGAGEGRSAKKSGVRVGNGCGLIDESIGRSTAPPFAAQKMHRAPRRIQVKLQTVG